MGFKVGAKFKVWNIYENNGKLSAQISISNKDKNGKWTADFNHIVMLFGNAKNLKVGDSAIIAGCESKAIYDKENNKNKYYFYVYAIDNGNNDCPNKHSSSDLASNDAPLSNALDDYINDDEPLPF